MKQLSRLDYWIQRAIPFVYDDTLSLYELVAKTVAYLNNVIESQNDLSKEMAEFLDRFDGDLTETITEILNEWLVDGTLAQIINDEVFNMKLDKTVYQNYNTVNVKDYGALGNGIKDDTQSIQNAVDYVYSKGGGTVFIPNGVYMIKAEDVNNTLPHLWDTGGIIMRSNVNIEMQANTVLQAIKSHQGIYHVITIYRSHNIKISGGQIIGERKVHEGSDGEFGFGINIAGYCDNIQIENIHISDCWGDAINVNNRLLSDDYPVNIIIRNVVADNNRRQGISINSGKNILIEKCVLKNTNGTLPSNGLDIEPWATGITCENIVVRDCEIYGNAKEGLSITAADFGEVIKNVLIDNCIIRDNLSTLAQIHNYSNNKDVVFNNCTIINTTGDFAVQNTGSETIFDKCTIKGGGVVSRKLNGKGSVKLINSKIDSQSKVLFYNDAELEVFNTKIENGVHAPLGSSTFVNNMFKNVNGFIVQGNVLFENNTILNNKNVMFFMDTGSLHFLNNTVKDYESNIIYLNDRTETVINNNTIITSSSSPSQALTGLVAKNIFMRNNTFINKSNVRKMLIEVEMDASCNSDYRTYVRSDYGLTSQIIWEISTGKTLVCTTPYSYSGGVFVPAKWVEI